MQSPNPLLALGVGAVVTASAIGISPAAAESGLVRRQPSPPEGADAPSVTESSSAQDSASDHPIAQNPDAQDRIEQRFDRLQMQNELRQQLNESQFELNSGSTGANPLQIEQEVQQQLNLQELQNLRRDAAGIMPSDGLDRLQYEQRVRQRLQQSSPSAPQSKVTLAQASGTTPPAEETEHPTAPTSAIPAVAVESAPERPVAEPASQMATVENAELKEDEAPIAETVETPAVENSEVAEAETTKSEAAAESPEAIESAKSDMPVEPAETPEVTEATPSETATTENTESPEAIESAKSETPVEASETPDAAEAAPSETATTETTESSEAIESAKSETPVEASETPDAAEAAPSETATTETIEPSEAIESAKSETPVESTETPDAAETESAQPEAAAAENVTEPASTEPAKPEVVEAAATNTEPSETPEVEATPSETPVSEAAEPSEVAETPEAETSEAAATPESIEIPEIPAPVNASEAPADPADTVAQETETPEASESAETVETTESTESTTEASEEKAEEDDSESTAQAEESTDRPASQSERPSRTTEQAEDRIDQQNRDYLDNSEAPAPEYLDPDANPLAFPTRPEEVDLVGTQPITLQQAIQLAIRNNPTLQQERLQLERTQAALREAEASNYPSLDATASFTQQGQESFQAERQQLAPTGNPQQPLTTVTIPSETIYTDSTALGANLELSYPIYTSGRRSALIRSSQGQVRLQQLELERQTEDLILNTTDNYYDLQQASAQVNIFRANLDEAEQSLRDAQALERAGVGTRFDVLQAEVDVANARQELTQQLSQLEIARRQLSQRLSVAETVNLEAADLIEVSGVWDLSLPETIVQAYKNRAELEQQLIQREIAQQNRRAALAQLGPQLAFNGSFGLTNDLDRDPGFLYRYQLGLTASLSLYDGGEARAQANQQESNIAIAEAEFQNQRDQIRFQVEQAYSQLDSNFANIQTTALAVEQAAEALRLARLRFQAGVGTQTDVLRQQTALAQAQVNNLQAILDYNRALATLQRQVSNYPEGLLNEQP